MSKHDFVANSPISKRLRLNSTSPVMESELSAGITLAEDSLTSLPRIQLNATETKVKQLLLDVAKYIDNQTSSWPEQSDHTVPKRPDCAGIELRFTGGWVRDKLLDVDSQDIDVSINKMTGLQFGVKMLEYLEIPDNPEKYGMPSLPDTTAEQTALRDEVKTCNSNIDSKAKRIGGLHKIEANPEKSKHLETVTTKILGLDVDLVNLRKETYHEDSRNPQMEFGTPLEDALRRDATVNALFYNLHSGLVEDFTELGLKDMELKIIRTPMDPRQTFKDDPLRVLRLIRFASRLGYKIDPEAEEAMSDETIQKCLEAKISRERVGVEIEKMLRGMADRPVVKL